MPILIKNCIAVDCNGISKKNISIIDGQISKEQDKSDYVIDANGMIATPGFANCHTHIAMSVFRNYADDMLLKEWLEKKIWPLESKLTKEVVKISALVSCIEMLKCGTTVINEMYGFSTEIAESVAKAGMRGVIGYGMIDLWQEKKRNQELNKAEKIRKAIQKQKLLSFAYCPHAIYTCSDQLIAESARRAKKNNCILHIHASETRQEVFECIKKTGKKPIEHLHSLGALWKKTVLAHCGWISLKEIMLVSRSRASVVHCPVSNMKLANGDVAPIAEMLKSRVNVCLGTDGPASNNSQDIIETAKLASIAQKNYLWNPKIMTAKETFICITRNGYKALGLNGGTLRNGALGDVVLIDWKKANTMPYYDPYAMIAYSLKPENINSVIIGGRPVMQERTLTFVDEQKVLEKFEKTAQEFVEKASD